MRKYRILSLILAAIMLAGVLAGCKQSKGTDGGDTSAQVSETENGGTTASDSESGTAKETGNADTTGNTDTTGNADTTAEEGTADVTDSEAAGTDPTGTTAGTPTGTTAAATTAKEPEVPQANAAETWLLDKIENNKLFSFSYNGKAFGTFIGSWKKKLTQKTTGGRTYYTLTYTSPDGTVTAKAEVSLDPAYSHLDWVCNFKNSGAKNSPTISDVLPLDSTVPYPEARLHTAFGSECTANDFLFIGNNLASSGSYSMGTDRGRSSDGGVGAFPFFDICNGPDGKVTEGIVGAIGWTGSWKADFKMVSGAVSMKAGMREVSTYLLPGEEMRTPSVSLVFFKGNMDDGHNLFRKVVLKDYTPKDEKGKTLTQLPVTISSWGYEGSDTLIKEVKDIESKGIKYDYFWVDAGWYCGAGSTNWSGELGKWVPNASKFPNGFKPLSDTLKSYGRKLLVWFEPERAAKKYVIDSKYMFPATVDSAYYNLWNLADDNCEAFLASFISKQLKDGGISCYRQDFNMSPAEAWEKTDTKDRIGMTEIKYITNLYKYLDTLLANNPGLLIDDCASGGRRIDIEMLKRCIVLWRTDFEGKGCSSPADGSRSINFGLSYWIPMAAGGPATIDRSNKYIWRAQASAGLVVGYLSVSSDKYSGIEEFYSYRKYMTGDYYPLKYLTDPSEIVSKNIAYEYYLPSENSAVVFAFRPKSSTAASQNFKLKGLKAGTNYTVTISDTGETYKATGSVLMTKGITLDIPAALQSRIIYIKG